MDRKSKNHASELREPSSENGSSGPTMAHVPNVAEKLQGKNADSYREVRSVASDEESNTCLGTTKVTFDRLLRMQQPDACIALYMFFCYTARWQKTSQARCTASYCAKALQWSESTVRRIKTRLIDAGLLENVRQIDRKTGKVRGWYVRVRYAVHQQNRVLCANQENESTRSNNHPVEARDPNAFERISGNAVKSDRSSVSFLSSIEESSGENVQKNSLRRESPTRRLLEEQALLIYRAYPKQVDQFAAIKQIKAALRKYDFSFLLSKVQRYAATRTGENPEFTASPDRFFRNGKFLDDEAQWMKRQTPASGPETPRPKIYLSPSDRRRMQEANPQ